MYRKLVIVLCLLLTGCASKNQSMEKEPELPNITATLAICGDAMSHMPQTIADSLLYRDLKATKALNPDLIAVMFHWGDEYQTRQDAYQEEVAKFLFKHGADIILGGHPHVLQPMETRTLTDAEGHKRTGFVCWSLGNFISAQNKPYTDTTVVLQLELTKNQNTGVSEITGVQYIPMYMLDRETEINGERYTLLDARKSIADYEAGASGAVSHATYRKLQAAVSTCHDILGVKWEQTR